MLLTDARRDARVDAGGELVLLEEQDRVALGRRGRSQEGLALVERRCAPGPSGAYALQAAIAGVHAQAARAADTDWREIAGALRAARRAPSVAGRGAEPRRRGRDGRGARRGPAPARRPRRRRNARGLSPAAGGARRSAAPPRPRATRPPPRTARRWRWSATMPNGASCAAVSASSTAAARAPATPEGPIDCRRPGLPRPGLLEVARDARSTIVWGALH